MRVLPALPCLIALVATAAVAATRGDVEREIARVASDREQLRGARQELLVSASSLAERISHSKQIGIATRASPLLTKQLRELDRLADRLDAVERQLAEVERTLRRLLGAFDEAALEEERSLEKRAKRDGARAVAAEVTALAAARERLAPLRDGAGFRSALEISLEPLDGPAELEAKIAIIDGERLRISKRLVELGGEEVVLAMRLQAKRQWARELGAARREAGGGVELLDQVHERTEAAVRSLTTRVEAMGRERDRLQASDSVLATTRREAEQRLRSLDGRQEPR